MTTGDYGLNIFDGLTSDKIVQINDQTYQSIGYISDQQLLVFGSSDKSIKFFKLDEFILGKYEPVYDYSTNFVDSCYLSNLAVSPSYANLEETFIAQGDEYGGILIWC